MIAKKKSPVAKQIQYEGLTTPIDTSELRAYYEEKRNNASSSFARGMYTFGAVMKWVGLGLAAMTSLVLFICGITIPNAGMAVSSFVVVAVTTMIYIAVTLEIRKKARKQIRLRRFAYDNGWQYAAHISNPTYAGLIFSQGHSRSASNIVYSTADPEAASFEIGEYQYTVGSGKYQRTYWWTYCCVELDRHVPHMVLDATDNNAKLFGRDVISNLPSSFRKDQVLKLEGDFNKYFTLYAPEKYKRDAYYVFTPNLMALLIDGARAFDAEVVDNRLYVYAQLPGHGGKTIADPQFMFKFLQIIHTVGMTMRRQTENYSDEYVGDRSADQVASHGRRLRTRVGIVSLIIVGGYVLLQIFLFLAEIISDLGRIL